jgi:hypothetical protein
MSEVKKCAVSPIGVCTPKCIEFNKCRKNPYKQEEKKEKIKKKL